MTKRNLRFSGFGLAALTLGAIAACSSTDTNTNPGGAGSSSTAGTSSGGAAGAAAGTPGTAGTATAGTSTGGGGAGSGFACVGTKPTSALITEFADLAPVTTGGFTYTLGVPGGTFSYQPPDMFTLTDTGMALNVTGKVTGYDGFGLYFNTCTDASAFTGVSFNVKGYAGPGGKLNFRVQTNTNTKIDTAHSKGACVVPAGSTDYDACHDSGINVDVTATGAVVTVDFSKLTGGVPMPSITGNNILGLEWAFVWDANAGSAGAGAGGASGGSGGASGGSGGASAGSGGKGGASAAGAGGKGGASSGGAGGASSGGSGGATTGSGGSGTAGPAGSYDANITIDDIKFIGGAPAGGAGGASAGGASAGGSGGASAGSGGASAGTGGKAGSGG